MDLQTGERHEVGPFSFAVYAPSGYLVHRPQAGVGLANTAFDRDALSVGETFPLETSGGGFGFQGTEPWSTRAASQPPPIVVRDRSGDVLDPWVTPSWKLRDPPSPRTAAALRSACKETFGFTISNGIATRLTSTQGGTFTPPGCRPALRSLTKRGRRLGPGCRWQRARKGGYCASEWSGFGICFLVRGRRYVSYSSADPAGGEGGIWYRKVAPGARSRNPLPTTHPFPGEQRKSLPTAATGLSIERVGQTGDLRAAFPRRIGQMAGFDKWRTGSTMGCQRHRTLLPPRNHADGR